MPLFTYPSLLVFSTSSHHYVTGNAKQCTLGFPIRKLSGQRFAHAFLTLGSCMSTDRDSATNGAFYIRTTWGGNEEIRIGTAGRLTYSRQGLNYAIVILTPNSPYGLWSDFISSEIEVPGGFAAIIARAFAPGAGAQVCFKGGYSGSICGEVTDAAARLTYTNPWKWEADVRERVLVLSPIESWSNLIKVRLDTIPRAFTEDVRGFDFGSPVYYVRERNAEGRATKVQPVGILMDYVYEESEDGSRCEVYMYCVSVYRILLNDDSLQLIGDPAV